MGESDLLKSSEEFPTESPDLRRGLACFLLGPEPLIDPFGGLNLKVEISQVVRLLPNANSLKHTFITPTIFKYLGFILGCLLYLSIYLYVIDKKQECKSPVAVMLHMSRSFSIIWMMCE